MRITPGTELSFLQAEMLHSAFIRNCLQDLKKDAVICGEIGSVEIRVGRYLLVSFPVADVLDTNMFSDMLSNLAEIYDKKFLWYKEQIRLRVATPGLDGKGKGQANG